MNKIFLAYSFRPENQELVQDIERIVRSHHLVLVTGEILGGAGLSPAIQRSIQDTDALIALFTREHRIEGEQRWLPTRWVVDEYGIARQNQRLAIAMIEDSVDSGGAYAGNEYIPFKREARCEAMIRLSETIGYWKREAGRSLEIRLLPEAAATLASNDNARCEYRLVSPVGPPTDWKEASARPTPGGVFLIVPRVKIEQAIEIRISAGNVAKWRSAQWPQWVHVELRAVV